MKKIGTTVPLNGADLARSCYPQGRHAKPAISCANRLGSHYLRLFHRALAFEARLLSQNAPAQNRPRSLEMTGPARQQRVDQ